MRVLHAVTVTSAEGKVKHVILGYGRTVIDREQGYVTMQHAPYAEARADIISTDAVAVAATPLELSGESFGAQMKRIYDAAIKPVRSISLDA